MITIQEYYKLHNEDFNSHSGSIFKLKYGSENIDIICFYEELSGFIDIHKYMKSFETNNAMNVMGDLTKDGRYTGILFVDNLDMYMFITGFRLALHDKLCFALDKSHKKVYPILREEYIDIYYGTETFGQPHQTDLPDDIWCLPFRYSHGGIIETNL